MDNGYIDLPKVLDQEKVISAKERDPIELIADDDILDSDFETNMFKLHHDSNPGTTHTNTRHFPNSSCNTDDHIGKSKGFKDVDANEDAKRYIEHIFDQSPVKEEDPNSKFMPGYVTLPSLASIPTFSTDTHEENNASSESEAGTLRSNEANQDETHLQRDKCSSEADSEENSADGNIYLGSDKDTADYSGIQICNPNRYIETYSPTENNEITEHDINTMPTELSQNHHSKNINDRTPKTDMIDVAGYVTTAEPFLAKNEISTQAAACEYTSGFDDYVLPPSFTEQNGQLENPQTNETISTRLDNYVSGPLDNSHYLKTPGIHIASPVEKAVTSLPRPEPNLDYITLNSVKSSTIT